MHRKSPAKFSRWDKQALDHLRERGIEIGSIVEIRYPDDCLWIFIPPDPEDPEDNGRFEHLMCNEYGVEEEPPTLFFVTDIWVYCEDLVLIKLLGGCCYGQDYYFLIDSFEACLNFEQAIEELKQIELIQSSS